jgi:hypothetical protein
LQSTAVRKAAREVPADGPSGVVYVSVKDTQDFSTKLCSILGFEHGAVDLREGLRRKGMEETKPAAPDPALEPQASWRPLSDALYQAAKDFRCAALRSDTRGKQRHT